MCFKWCMFVRSFPHVYSTRILNEFIYFNVPSLLKAVITLFVP